MASLPSEDIACPYCGETITLFIDTQPDDQSAGDQHYIEDCQVCCRPIDIRVRVDQDGDVHVDARAEDDA